MPDRRRASQLRQRIALLGRELAAVQQKLLKPRRMIAASLIQRHLGTSEHKRASTAFYLSCARQGRTRLVHVSKDRVDAVRCGVQQWRAYRAGLRRWRKVSSQMADLLRELGEVQAEHPGGEQS
jgi:hypothetical protein